MSHHPSLNSHVLSFLPEDLDNMVILDVGCGFGEWGFIIRTRKSGSPHLIGMEVWRPYLEKIKPLKIYEELIRTVMPHVPLKDGSVDISVVCEILEHLPKNFGYNLIKELERVTRKITIVSVPLDWPQEDARNNPFERHVSEWTLEELVELGYKGKVVEIQEFPKTLRIVDKIRRLIFRLRRPPRLIIAYKSLEL